MSNGFSICVDLAGDRFGRLVVVRRAGRSSDRKAMWLCRCDCGREIRTMSRSLRVGLTRSCGCIRREVARNAINSVRPLAHRALTVHGCARQGRKTAEYRVWRNMLTRCRDKNNPTYPYYGGRGISVCSRWSNFEAFLADMGPKPGPGHSFSIDRVNNDGNYEPGNCRWATPQQQAANKRKPRRRDHVEEEARSV